MDGASRDTMAELGHSPGQSTFHLDQRGQRKLSILVADDMPAYERIIRHVLRPSGHQLIFARDGRQALEQFENGTFDVVVVDLQMPVMNGVEVARAIRAREPAGRRTPIIGLTAHSSTAQTHECTEAGMDICLPKPLDPESLMRMIEKLTMPDSNKLWTAPQGTSGGHQPNDDEVVDYQGAMIRLGGDSELFREFVKVYDEDVPGLMNGLRRGAAERAAEVVERSAHSIRGLISNFGARHAVEAASELEGIGKRHEWAELDAAMQNLERQIERLTAALNPYR